MKEEITLTAKNAKMIKGFTIKQFIFLIFGIILMLGGIAFLVCGLIGDYGNFYNNPFESVSQNMVAFFHFGMTLTWFGVFLLLFGSLVFALSLSFSSKTEEREKEKEARKNERMKAFKEARKDIVIDIEQTSATASTIVPEEK